MAFFLGIYEEFPGTIGGTEEVEIVTCPTMWLNVGVGGGVSFESKN